MSDDGWGFADMYSMDDDGPQETTDITDVQGDDWRNILVVGRATGRTVYPETLALIGHARYLADGLGCRVEVLLVGEDLARAVETVQKYAVDAVYTVKAPDYAPIAHTAAVLEQVVRKRRPELVLIFQSRSGDAIGPYAASRLGVSCVLGASKLEIDTAERQAIVTHAGANADFQVITKMEAKPQFVTVQRGVFRAPIEDPYSSTQVHALDIDVGPVAAVEVIEQLDPPAPTLQTAERVVVVGSGIHSKEEREAGEKLAKALDAFFAVSPSVVDRGLSQEGDVVMGQYDGHASPKLLVCVGCSGALDLLQAIDSDPTMVAVASPDGDPLNDKSTFRVSGTVLEAVQAVLDAL